MNWLVKWLQGWGVLRVHWFAYWVTYVSAVAPPYAGVVLATCRRVRESDDVAELGLSIDAEIGMRPGGCRVMTWDRLPGDDVFLRDTRRWRARRHRADTGAVGADLLAGVFLLCMWVCLAYVLGWLK